MKLNTFVGALVGSLLGAVVWYVLETGTPPRDAVWAPVLVGLLAGLGAALADRASTPSYQRGAVTAAIAIGAMVAARQGITHRLTDLAAQNREPIPRLANFQPGEEEEEEYEVDITEDEPTPSPTLENVPVTSAVKSTDVPPDDLRRYAWRNQSGVAAACFVVGTLLAYVLGKGGCCRTCQAPPSSSMSEQNPQL